jgi:cellulose synthase/poly-beta-1,6-N-acetylglucosamine synthase-like glycosyltransferase
MLLLVILALGGLGAVVYSYAIYPVLLIALAAIDKLFRDARGHLVKRDSRDKPITRHAIELPAVAVVISAFNEQRHIAKRIQNLLSLEYPAHLLRAYIGSDGSRDDTGAILSACEDQRIRAFVFEQNRGKANVLNDLVARTSEPILVFSDANTLFERGALLRLVEAFNDPRVGCVSGELRLHASQGNNQDSLYWRIEQVLKLCEARIGGLLGANGAIYAIRRSLWRPLRGDTICDDFCVAMNIAAAGHRLVYEPSAWAEEDTPASIGEEYLRRVRIGIGNYQALTRHPEYFLRTSAVTRFAYISHKVLRWIAPHLLLVSLAASCLLAIDSTAWRWFASAQVAAYASAWLLFCASQAGWRLPALLRLPAFLFALNWAFLVASVRVFFGRYGGSWQRSSR